MRNTWKTTSLVIAAVALTAVTGADTAAAESKEGLSDCRATPLPALGLGHSELLGGDPSGRYLVGLESGEIDGVPVIKVVVWTKGKIREFDTRPLLPYADVRAVDANRDGMIVGYRMRDFSSFHQDAWLYRDGRFTLLPGLRATDVTVPTGINARGDVAGYSLDPTGNSGTFHAVVWPARNPGAVRELTVASQPGVWAMAVGIDDDGTVLGWVGGRPGQTNYIWPPRGAGYALQRPADDPIVEASAIRNGWVVGQGQVGEQPVGLQWNLRTGGMKIISTEYASAVSVNSRGTVGAVGAIIHRNGRAVPLGPGAIPVVMMDNGNAAGMTSSPGSPVLWTGCGGGHHRIL